jgi:hypothetical protein
MTFIVNFTVLFDTENAREAMRLRHKLFEVIIDEDYVLGLAGDPVIPGELEEPTDA